VTYLSLAKYSPINDPRVLAKIRRTIAGAMAGGECVVVLLHDVKNLSDPSKAEITRGWPASKVSFSLVHPTLATPPAKKRRRPRRRI
jgi:hypothetical protein